MARYRRASISRLKNLLLSRYILKRSRRKKKVSRFVPIEERQVIRPNPDNPYFLRWF